MHSIISPSAFHRTLACPASLLSSLWAPRTSSLAADRGTELHNQAEYFLKCLTTGAEAKPVSEELECYLAHCSDLIKGATDFGIEGKSELSFMTEGLISMFGTVDFWSYHQANGEVNIVDLKTGAAYVSPDNNPQLSLYAIGIVSSLSETFPDCEIRTINLSICQGSQVLTETIDLLELNRRETLYRDAIRLAMSARAPYAKETGNHCKYCPARSNCPTVTESFQKALSIDTTEAEELPNLTLVEIMRLANMASEVFETAKAQLQSRFDNHGELADGLKLRNYQPPKSWIDKAEAAKAILAIEPDAISKGLLVPAGPASVVKAIPGLSEQMVTPAKRMVIGLD